jgi:hypothetical protein
VDHLCYKCQTSIDEALPFCPHCGAPQIRVASPDDDPSLTVSSSSHDGSPQLVTPASWTLGAPARTSPGGIIQWELAWKGALLSGLGAAVLTAMPLMGLGCCLWLLGAGALAVWLYQRRIPGSFVTPGMGMRIGAVAGAIGFVANALWMVFHFVTNSQELRSAAQEALNKSVSANPDPRAQEIMRQFMGNLETPQGLATCFVLILAIMAVAFVIFGAAGGALGASMFSRRRDFR